jgi:phage anti-repressor protein
MSKQNQESVDLSTSLPVTQASIGNTQCATVDGRTLHRVLDVNSPFANWIKRRIAKYEFIEGQDFEVFSRIEKNPFDVFTNSGENSDGGRPSQEYKLTIDMGKEICMVENNAQGKLVRRYFIECERRALESCQPAIPETTTPSTADDRKPLRSLVNAWAKVANVHQSTLWPQVRGHFQLSQISDLPVEWIPDALAFVQRKIDGAQKALPEPPLQAKMFSPEPAPEQKALPLSLADMDRLHMEMLEHMRKVAECGSRFSQGLDERAKRIKHTSGHNVMCYLSFAHNQFCAALDAIAEAMLNNAKAMAHLQKMQR